MSNFLWSNNEDANLPENYSHQVGATDNASVMLLGVQRRKGNARTTSASTWTLFGVTWQNDLRENWSLPGSPSNEERKFDLQANWNEHVVPMTIDCHRRRIGRVDVVAPRFAADVSDNTCSGTCSPKIHQCYHNRETSMLAGHIGNFLRPLDSDDLVLRAEKWREFIYLQ